MSRCQSADRRSRDRARLRHHLLPRRDHASASPRSARSSSTSSAGAAPGTVERLDPLEPLEHRLALVHRVDRSRRPVARRVTASSRKCRVRRRARSGARRGRARAARDRGRARARSRSRERSTATSARRTASSHGRVRPPRPPASARELAVELLARARVLLEEHGSSASARSHRGAPRARRAAARRGTARSGRARAPSGRAPRPARDRRRRRRARPGRSTAIGVAERVEPRRLAGRLRRGDRQHRLDPERTPVERLEEHRPGGERRGRREPQRADRVGDLRRRVGRAPRRRRAPDGARATHIRSGSRPKSGGRSPLRLGPVRRELAGGERPHGRARGELDRLARSRGRRAARSPCTGGARRRATPRAARTRARTTRRPSRSRRTPPRSRSRRPRSTVRKSASSSVARGPA